MRQAFDGVTCEHLLEIAAEPGGLLRQLHPLGP
jgi:hypothetical protein